MFSIELWENHKISMSEDILYQLQKSNKNAQYNDEIYNETLRLLEDICECITQKKINEFGLQTPNYELKRIPSNTIQYNQHELETYVNQRKPLLNEEQKLIYNTIMKSIDNCESKIYFLDAPGGTGKTYLLNLILNEIRRQNKVVLAVASSGKLKNNHEVIKNIS